MQPAGGMCEGNSSSWLDEWVLLAISSGLRHGKGEGLAIRGRSQGSEVTTSACWPPLHTRCPSRSGRRPSRSPDRRGGRSTWHRQCDPQRTSAWTEREAVGSKVDFYFVLYPLYFFSMTQMFSQDHTVTMQWNKTKHAHFLLTSLILKKAIPVSRESEPAWCCGPIRSSSSCSATSCNPPFKKKTVRKTYKAHALFFYAPKYLEVLAALHQVLDVINDRKVQAKDLEEVHLFLRQVAVGQDLDQVTKVVAAVGKHTRWRCTYTCVQTGCRENTCGRRAIWLRRRAQHPTSSAAQRRTASRCPRPRASWIGSQTWSVARWSPGRTCLPLVEMQCWWQ